MLRLAEADLAVHEVLDGRAGRLLEGPDHWRFGVRRRHLYVHWQLLHK